MMFRPMLKVEIIIRNYDVESPHRKIVQDKIKIIYRQSITEI